MICVAGPQWDGTCLSHCHRTCWGYDADLLWSGTVWGRNPGPPGPQSSGSCRQRRPLSWPRWAASAGRGAGSCRTAAEGSGGPCRRWTVSNRCAPYWTVCFLWKRVTQCFLESGDSPVFVLFVWQSSCIDQPGCYSLFQELLKAFHSLFDLLCVVQAEERVLGGQVWKCCPSVGKEKIQQIFSREDRSWGCVFFTAYIGMEFALSFCRSHANSLYLLLTHEIFLVKHTLVVWQGTSPLSDGWDENSHLPFIYSRASKFHSLCRHAKSRSSVAAGPAPRCWWPAAWMEKSEETLNWVAKKGKFFYQQTTEVDEW